MTSLENNIAVSFRDAESFNSVRAAVRTKIICTIGPKTKSVDTLGKLVEAGMNVMRLNFSHGDHTYHSGVITNLREYLAASKRMAAIMLDTKYVSWLLRQSLACRVGGCGVPCRGNAAGLVQGTLMPVTLGGLLTTLIADC